MGTVIPLVIYYVNACQAADNAVAESFFHLLKTERIRRKTYKTRTDARQDAFDYIELFYNLNAGMLITGCCHPLIMRWQQK